MNKVLAVFFCCWIGVILSGCCQRHITAHTSYLNRSQLASYHVDTPDPLLRHPLYGQRLLVYWTVPHAYIRMSDLHLDVTIRFGDRTEEKLYVPICNSTGIYQYEIVGENYFEKEGILTYKVDLIGDNVLWEEWRHQLWVDLITIGLGDAAP